MTRLPKNKLADESHYHRNVAQHTTSRRQNTIEHKSAKQQTGQRPACNDDLLYNNDLCGTTTFAHQRPSAANVATLLHCHVVTLQLCFLLCYRTSADYPFMHKALNIFRIIAALAGHVICDLNCLFGPIKGSVLRG